VAVQKRLSDPLSFLVVAGAVLVTRLPFLGPGLGADADAWRVYLAGRNIALTGAYTASRLPGYPVIEYTTALGWPLGYEALNALTALMSAMAVAFFALTLRRLGARTWWAGAAALALVPVMFVNSVVLMDYVWALAFMLGAVYFVATDRAALGGLFLGLAAGCRITSAAALVPLTLMVLTRDRAEVPLATRGRAAAALVGAAVVVAALLFSPVLGEYGASFLTFIDTRVTASAAWERFRSGWGDLGLVALVLGAVSIPAVAVARRGQPAHRRPARPVLGAPLPTYWPVAWGLGVLIYLAAYLRLPLESGYLLPMVPFVLLLAAALLDERAWLGACALLALAWSVGFAGTATVPGPLFQAQRSREVRLATAMAALDDAARLGPRTAILAESTLPAIEALQLDRPRILARLLYRPDPTELARLKEQGYAIYYLKGVDKLIRDAYGLDLAATGARPLDE
jgi:hypothetical protein